MMKVIMDDCKFDPDCAARHIADWLLEPTFVSRAVAAIRVGTWQVDAAEHVHDDGLLFLVEDGIATIPINGPMMKGDSKFGGTNSLRTRRAVRRAAADASISGIMLLVDSPGGTAAGTGELANDILNARKAKPVFAHGEDMIASAAFWLVSQAEFVSANTTAEVGSIGTVAVVEDSSIAAEMEGITVHVISTGEFKGAFVPGVPVTQEHLDMLQERVNDLNEHFLKAVSVGRKMSMRAVRNIADGRVHIAEKAKELGLIDAVMTADQAMAGLRNRIARAVRVNKAKAKIGV